MMLRIVRALLAKELLIERRTPQVIPAMVLFSLSVFVVFHFALDRDSVDGRLAAGLLVTTLLLASLLGIGRLFTTDYEEGGFDGFLLAPAPRIALLVAKVVALTLFLICLEIVAVPAFVVLLLGPSLDGQMLVTVTWTLLLADLGIAVIGALVGALAVPTRVRDLLVPLITLPLLVPIVIATATLLSAAFAAAGPEPIGGRWVTLLGLYDGIFALLAYGVFDYLVED